MTKQEREIVSQEIREWGERLEERLEIRFKVIEKKLNAIIDHLNSTSFLEVSDD